MDIYFITYHPECGETFLSLFPVGEHSIDIIIRAVAKLRLGYYNLRIENGRHSTPKLPEHLRICQCCSSNEVENEVHCYLFLPVIAILVNELLRKMIKCQVIIFTPRVRQAKASFPRRSACCC